MEFHRQHRFFDSRDPEVMKEVFPETLGRKFETNTVFDYSQPEINAVFPETYESGTVRMNCWVSQLGQRFAKGVDNPRKLVDVVVCHGFFVDGFSKEYVDPAFNHVHKYCCTHLGLIKNAVPGQKPEVEVLVHGHLAW